MAEAVTIQLQVDEKFYQAIINRAEEKGFTNYLNYIKELCTQDISIDSEVLRKLNRIMEILSD